MFEEADLEMALFGWHTQFACRLQPGKGKRDPKAEGRSSKVQTLQPSVFRPSNQLRFSRLSRLNQALDTQRR